MKRKIGEPGSKFIADIHIGRVYDQRDPDGEIHYEMFARLADFFGRNPPARRHLPHSL